MKKKILGVLLVVGIIAGVIAGCGNSNTTPVSYTHLDVYKRQAMYKGY